MHYRLLFAILSTAFLEQTAVSIVRVTTTYRVGLSLAVSGAAMRFDSGRPR